MKKPNRRSKQTNVFDSSSSQSSSTVDDIVRELEHENSMLKVHCFVCFLSFYIFLFNLESVWMLRKCP